MAHDVSQTRRDCAATAAETEIGLREVLGSQILWKQRERESSRQDDLMLPQSGTHVLVAQALRISLPSTASLGCNTGCHVTDLLLL